MKIDVKNFKDFMELVKLKDEKPQEYKKLLKGIKEIVKDMVKLMLEIDKEMEDDLE